MSSEIVAALEDTVSEHHLLKHAFYQDWTAGQLPMERLQSYAVRYYPHVAAFPRYISAMHTRCADLETRQVLLENLVEEESGDDNHPELWLRFAEALGVPREEVTKAEPVPAAEALVQTFHGLASDGPLAQGLAALFVYERQIPPIATAKIHGLQRWYGVDDDRGLAFFRVHEEADVWHAGAVARLIEKHAIDEADADAAVEGGKRAVAALWEMLDAV